MPRSVAEIIAQADQLADRFETWESDPTRIQDGKALAKVHETSQRAAAAQRALADAITEARREGFSWALIGAMVGTTGEAARQRYGK